MIEKFDVHSLNGPADESMMEPRSDSHNTSNFGYLDESSRLRFFNNSVNDLKKSNLEI